SGAIKGSATLSSVTVENKGTLTAGPECAGIIEMKEGAQIKNVGTFKEEHAEYSACSSQGIHAGSGAAPRFTNTGSFKVALESAGRVSEVAVPFTNEGTVNVELGQLRLAGGGTSSTGASWLIPSG